MINQTGVTNAAGGGATTTVTTFTNPGAKRTLFFEARCVAYDGAGSIVNSETIAGGASGAATGAMFFLSGSTTSPVSVVSNIGDDGGLVTWSAAISGNDLAINTRNSLVRVVSASVVLTGLLIGNT